MQFARQASRCVAALAVALLAGCVGVAPQGAGEWQTLAPGIYMLRGSSGEPAPANGGRVSNLGLIVGTAGAIVVGTGTSAAEGARVHDSARALAGVPVALAVNLHASPDHVLGNGAFAQRGVPLVAHAETARFMIHNCTRCIDTLRGQIGAQALAGTEMHAPERLLQGSDRLRAGGREIELMHFGHTFQPGALALFDRHDGVLYAGELVSIEQVPDAHNAHLGNWTEALRTLQALPVEWVVPAHGPAVAPARIAECARYLDALRAGVSRAYQAGATLAETVRDFDLPEFRVWARYAELHPRNVHRAYLEIEEEDLAR